MGGRGSSSGMSGGRGWGSQPNLSGSDKQVKWANDIRENIKNSIDFNIRSASEHYERTNITSSMIKRDLYRDAKKELKPILSKTDKASEIISMRDRLDPGKLNSTIERMSQNMATQVRNGYIYDKKTHRTKRK